MKKIISSSSIPSAADPKSYIQDLGTEVECCANESPKTENPKIRVKTQPVHIFLIYSVSSSLFAILLNYIKSHLHQ